MSQVYRMQINNVADYILNNSPDDYMSEAVDIFTFSSILAIANCKLKEDVLEDILNAQTDIIAIKGEKKPIQSYFAEKSLRS